MTKLPKQKFAWNQNITEDNLKILNDLEESERNSESKSLFKGISSDHKKLCAYQMINFRRKLANL